VLRRLCFGESAGLVVLLDGRLVQLDHTALVLMDALMLLLMLVVTLRQLIAPRVIGDDRRRATLHIVVMIVLIASHIHVQGVPALARVAMTGHLPLDEVGIHHARRLH